MNALPKCPKFFSYLRFSVLAVLLALALGCSVEHEPASDAKDDLAPPTQSRGTFFRFVEAIHPDKKWLEIKGRAGIEYRNVFRSPVTGNLSLDAGWPEGGVRLGRILDTAKLDQHTETVALTFVAGANRAYGVLSLEDAKRAGSWKDVLVMPPDSLLKAVSKIDSAPGSEGIKSVTAREVLSATPFEFPSVTVPKGALLTFGIALEQTMSPVPETATFSVVVNDGVKDEKVFDSKLTEVSDIALHGWQDHHVDLSRYSGKSVKFSFRVDTEAGNARSTVSPLWGDPILQGAPVENAAIRPNVILISLDTLRADHLGCYGYNRDTSPNIDRFAGSAYLFERCVAPSSWTTPSHASVFTGLNPIVHGAGALAGYRLQEDFVTLAEIARTTGYVTAAYTEGVAVGGKLGFYQGFDRYSNGIEKYGRPAPPGEAAKTFGEATGWLKEFGHLPFVLFVHTYEIHWPYYPPKGFENRFTSAPVDPGAYAQLGLQTLIDLKDGAPERQVLEDLYDGEIAYTDTAVDRFLKYLEQSGLLENTAVIIFSDHGEEFWEHGKACHGFNLYDDVLHVPLIIRLPGVTSSGMRVQHPVALEDIFHTVTDIIGADAPPYVSSQSLFPLMRGQSSSGYDREIIVSQLAQAPINTLMFAAEANKEKYIVRSVVTNAGSPLHGVTIPSERFRGGAIELRLIEHLLAGDQDSSNATTVGQREVTADGVSEELYRLSDDPRESNNLASREPDSLKHFHSILKQYLDKSVAASDALGLVVKNAPLTEEERYELGALGYL